MPATSILLTLAFVGPEPAEPVVSVESVEPVESPSDWTLGAFVDLSYPLNFNFPDNHVYRGTATTPRTNEFSIPAAGLLLTKEVSEHDPWWFELGVHAGSAVNALATSELAIPDADANFAGPQAFRHLARANAGFRLRSGTSIGGGLFSSPIGIGGFWSKDNWNYTPSWESNAAAFYLAGARVSQELPAGFSVDAWIVNGWQTNADANDAPSYLGAINWSGDDRWFLSQQLYAGPEGESLSPASWRLLSDTQLTYATDTFGLGAVLDLARDGADDIGGAPGATWGGAALFGRARLHERGRNRLYAAVRPEVYWDPDGRMFGANQTLLSATGTLDWWFSDAILSRLEYRYDNSTAPDGFFYQGSNTDPSGPGLAQQQHTIFFALTGTFEHRFARR